jgi:hypothetical protein
LDEYASPSGADLFASFKFIHLYFRDDDFLITPVRKGKFNIDYYGGDMIINPIPKVFDLGTFSYDLTKIK